MSAHQAPLDAAILFAPAGNLVLPALAALDRGGILAVAGITYRRFRRSITIVICSTRKMAERHCEHAGRRRRVPEDSRRNPDSYAYHRDGSRRRQPRLEGRLYRLNGAALKPVDDWVAGYERTWSARLDQLESVLADLQAEGERDDDGK